MRFAITFDYLCPFARNANEAVLSALAAGEPWEVRFRPFSLSQVHLGEDEPPVWERDDAASGVLALQWGIAARDHSPEVFGSVHRALFAARHDEGRDISDEGVVREAVGAAGGDVELLAKVVSSGEPLRTLAAEHTEAVERWGVFGVPTFIAGDEAVFVRFMERDRVDDVARALDLVEWSRLNEFKRTRVPR